MFRLESAERSIGLPMKRRKYYRYYYYYYYIGGVPTGAGNFTLHHRVQTGSGTHPASYAVGIRVSFPVGKAAWA
jgi:hypothetical protein